MSVPNIWTYKISSAYMVQWIKALPRKCVVGGLTPLIAKVSIIL